MTDVSTKPRAIFFVQIAIFLAAFLVGFKPTLLTLHGHWSSWTTSYSHGYLLVATATYLYFESDKVAPRWLPDIRGAAWILLAISSFGWLIFYLAGIGVLQQILLPIVLLALFASLLDTNRFWRTLLPIGLIYLAIPMWDGLLIHFLQRLSTTVSGWVVANLFGIPANISGFSITIPAGTIKIETGCAGIVFFLSAVTLGIVYGQLFLYRLRARVIALVVGGVLGILVNWIRITSLIVIGQISNMRNPLLTEGHLLFGWYLFSGLALATIFLASRMQSQHHSLRDRKVLSAKIAPLSAGRFVSTLLALVAGPLLLFALTSQVFSHTPTRIEPPQNLGAFLTRTQTRLTAFINPAINATYLYVPRPDLTVSLVSYPTFFGDGKLVDQTNRIWPENAEIIEQEQLNTEGLPPVLATRFKFGNQVKLAWGWYIIGDTHANTLGRAKLAQLKQTLRGNLGGSYIHFENTCQQVDCTLEKLTLTQNAPEIYAEISALLRKH